MTLKKSQILAFTDTETSGLNPFEDEIIQIAAIKVIHPKDDPCNIAFVDGGRLEIKIKPTKQVPEEVAKINGYDPEVWDREGVTLDEAMLKYLKFIEWTNFCGQNPHFDKGFLECAALKCELPWPRMQGYRLVAVEMMAWPLFLSGKIENVKQETLARYFDLGEQTHDAMDDVEQSIEIYRRLLPLVMSGF